MTTKSESKATQRRTSTKARSSSAKSDEKPTAARTSTSRTSTSRTSTSRTSKAKTAPRTGAADKPAPRTASSRATKATVKSTGTKSATAKPPAPRSASGRTSATAAGRGTAAKAPKQRRARSAAETEKIRLALNERLVELVTEYDSMMAELSDLQRDRLGDSAGDDQADTGTKTFEREQEISLANGIRDRISQVERALERLDGGHYGYCERCGNPIPAERLAAFPSVTLCVACKQLEERR